MAVSKFKSICISMDLNHNFKYTIYKTTNKVNGKMYIGCHKTTDPNDDYIGSGTILKRAIKKYGRENFVKLVLFVFDSPELMFDKEKEIVDRLFVESENTYNLLIGGWGGYDHINSTGKNLYGKNGDDTHGGQNLLKERFIEYKQFLIDNNLWDEWKRRVSVGLKKRYENREFHWTGRKHKQSTKDKIGKKNSIRQQGKSNSVYGTCWIYSNKEKINKRIPQKHLLTYLETGWIKGRKMDYGKK